MSGERPSAQAQVAPGRLWLFTPQGSMSLMVASVSISLAPPIVLILDFKTARISISNEQPMDYQFIDPFFHDFKIGGISNLGISISLEAPPVTVLKWPGFASL